MDRFAAMIVLLGGLVTLVLLLLALFTVAPVICCCLVALLYSLYLFMAYEESGVHHAQEFENRFWTVFALLLSTALFFAKDSPLAFGLWWSPSLGFLGVVFSGYAMHVWDRYTHRIAISRQLNRSSGHHHYHRGLGSSGSSGDLHASHGMLSQSLLHLRDLGIPVEAQLDKINECLEEIDQLLIPSTINNFINLRYVQAKEREIISIFEEVDARALNFLIGRVKLGLLFYKIKDHRNFHGKYRTELINLLAVERLSILTVMSRVILLHSLQLLKLRANPKAEYWVRYILLNTHQDDLSELKTLTDAKGDYFCMNKLVYDDIRSESIRQDILHHIRREAAIQQTHWQMGTRRNRRAFSTRPVMTWRKVLSDVDDTLYCSGGMYPAGVDKRYAKKTVYPGVLAFYRELDLGTQGPEEWEDNRVGNLVFLSARPHVYKDMSEKHNFAKFEKLQAVGDDGRKGMHTTPSLLAGDMASGSQFFVTNDFEPLARKKFDNFRRYVNLYPEFQHVFVCDNGQGDVRAGEMMFDSFPYEFESLYVHVVQDLEKTYGYDLQKWRQKEFSPVFFKTYPEAALHAASRHPPLIRMKGLQRICQDTVKDFALIKQWPSRLTKAERRQELNQAIWLANQFLEWHTEATVALIQAERLWEDGEKVRTPYGIATICGFDPEFDLYDIELDWRPLDVQVREHTELAKKSPRSPSTPLKPPHTILATVPETDEREDDTGGVGEQGNGDQDEPISQESGITQQCGEPSAERPPSSPLPEEHRTEQLLAAPTSPERTERSTSTSLDELDDTIPNGVADTAMDDCSRKFVVKARVSSQSISKFTPPTLPKLSKPSSLFTFFTGETTKRPETPKREIFEKGAEFSTPYGPVHVVEYREASRTVVVDMMGWNARAYLQEEMLSPLPRNILRSFLRQFSSDNVKKPHEFPYAHGTKITTPFGTGSVRRPLPPPSQPKKDVAKQRNATIRISLDNWTLADGSHPSLYCCEDTARAWKENAAGENPSLFSTLGSIVTSTQSLVMPFLQHKTVDTETPRKFDRYFKDAAAVTTPYGHGRVLSFRETDGVYEVNLVNWTLADGKHPRAFIRGVDMRCVVAAGCQEGYPLLTSLGLTGILASVEPNTGVHIVTVSSAGLVCYLQPECIVRPLKAAVGEDVLTQFGDGKVEKYESETDVYLIRLAWDARLYAKGDTFDRVGEGIQDRDGPFGVNWLLRMLFFSPTNTEQSLLGTRSRSNSIVSAKSQKSKG